MPLAVDPLGHDVVALLELYGPKMTVGEAYAHLSALISLRLLQLPLISARTVRALLDNEPPPADGNPCEMYVDFVRRKGGGSDELTAQCVLRDLEIMRNFFRDRLLIRSIGDAAGSMETAPAFDGTAEENLRAIVDLKDNPEIATILRIKLKQIEDELEAESDEQLFVREVRLSEGLTGTEKFIQVLVEGLRKRGLENQVKWFWSTGGITKSYGLLSGTLRYRPSWRYAPSDEALTTLLCLCFVEPGGDRTLTELPIQEVLRRLHDRFGILIDRPPTDFDSAERSSWSRREPLRVHTAAQTARLLPRSLRRLQRPVRDSSPGGCAMTATPKNLLSNVLVDHLANVMEGAGPGHCVRIDDVASRPGPHPGRRLAPAPAGRRGQYSSGRSCGRHRDSPTEGHRTAQPEATGVSLACARR